MHLFVRILLIPNCTSNFLFNHFFFLNEFLRFSIRLFYEFFRIFCNISINFWIFSIISSIYHCLLFSILNEKKIMQINPPYMQYIIIQTLKFSLNFLVTRFPFSFFCVDYIDPSPFVSQIYDYCSCTRIYVDF